MSEPTEPDPLAYDVLQVRWHTDVVFRNLVDTAVGLMQVQYDKDQGQRMTDDQVAMARAAAGYAIAVTEQHEQQRRDERLSRVQYPDDQRRRFDVRSLYRDAQQTDPWPGEGPLTVSKRWYEGEVPDQGAEGSSVGYAASHLMTPKPWDGHACSAMLPAPHGRRCSWCGTRPALDVSDRMPVEDDDRD